mgnify:FL=1
MFHFFTTIWRLVFSFDGINHAAQTPQCLEPSYTFNQTSVPTKISFIYIFINDDWPWMRFDDGVAFVRDFRSKTWGPCNKLKVLERKQTDLTSWCLKLYIMYFIMRFLSVAKHYQIAWPTVLCWRSWRCSLHSNHKQDVNIFESSPLNKRL